MMIILSTKISMLPVLGRTLVLLDGIDPNLVSIESSEEVWKA